MCFNANNCQRISKRHFIEAIIFKLFIGINQTSPPCTPPPSNYLCPEELDLLDPTHRGLHKFIPRHNDEIEIDIGDPIYVQKEDDDLWCEGKLYK